MITNPNERGNNFSPTLLVRLIKKKRDLAFAKTFARKKKKAENQRKRRAAIKAGKNISGKDYDHKTKRFTSIKSNRGNRGHGTKRE